MLREMPLCPLRSVLFTIFFLCSSYTAAHPSAPIEVRPSLLNNQTHNEFPSDQKVRGWVDQPNLRGTFDIIWTCLVTIFICTYAMLVLNLPSPQESVVSITGRRILWMGIGILGPEFPLTYAAGQWSRARQSVVAFKACNNPAYDHWNMRLAFFADMGGFVLHARDSQPFPLSAKQLHWLVVNRKVEFPLISAEELWDKSKQDRFVRLITAFQAGYFILQCIGRAVQRLSITTLELNTLAIVLCSLMTSFAWLHKPADVRVPYVVRSILPIEEITNNEPWKLTPLDFIDDHGPGYSVNVQPFMRLPVIPPQRPIQRIPNDRFPTDPYGHQEYLLCAATLIFTAVHVAGWRFSFPSEIERILWRVSSLTLFGITLTFWLLETGASWVRLGRWDRVHEMVLTTLPFIKRLKRRMASEKSKENVPFPQPWEFWSITPLALVYGMARFYMIVEAFVELRLLQATAFENVNWSQFIPHV